MGFSSLRIVTKTELSRYEELLNELYISAFKVVKTEKNGIQRATTDEEENLKKSEGNHRYKIAISFSGEYRDNCVEPFCRALLMLGYTKDDIFYDNWHKARFNGANGSERIQRIYKDDCRMIVVLLSPDYIDKKWTGIIEWPVIENLIISKKFDKICLLRIDSADIEDLSHFIKAHGIYEDVDNMSSDDIAVFINEVYINRFGNH